MEDFKCFILIKIYVSYVVMSCPFRDPIKCTQIRIDFRNTIIEYKIDNWGKYEVNDCQNTFQTFVAFKC
jgi:hypothetical protein